jgi:uncharacterized membrane protein
MPRSTCVIAAVAVAALASAASACGTAAGAAADGATADDGGTPDGTAPICSVRAPTSCPNPAPHYPAVAPIFEQHCVPCHFGTPGGPWPLTSYKHAVDWQDIIRTAMLECSMPPADAGTSMTDAERLAILTWIRCGFLE